MRDAKGLKHYKEAYDPCYASSGCDAKSTQTITDEENGIKYLPYEAVKAKYQQKADKAEMTDKDKQSKPCKAKYEKAVEYGRKCRKTNREDKLENKREYNREYQREYRKNNREEIREYNREYHAKNKERISKQRKTRYAARKAATAGI